MIFNNIPFAPAFEDYGKKIKIEKYASMEDTVRSLFEEAAPLIRPKAVCKECYIDEKGENFAVIGGTRFSGTVFDGKLDSAERVFAYVATCGNELDNFCRDPSDFMEQFLLDELKEMALRAALDYLRKYVKETYKLKKIASLNPGSADAHVWPIEQQEPLFSLLGDVKQEIGVTLTDSHLMLPNKSVSGIYFPTEVDYEMCEECTRENCPSRRGPFTG